MKTIVFGASGIGHSYAYLGVLYELFLNGEINDYDEYILSGPPSFIVISCILSSNVMGIINNLQHKKIFSGDIKRTLFNFLLGTIPLGDFLNSISLALTTLFDNFFQKLPTFKQLYEYTNKNIKIVLTNYKTSEPYICDHINTPHMFVKDAIISSFIIPHIIESDHFNKDYCTGMISSPLPLEIIEIGRAHV